MEKSENSGVEIRNANSVIDHMLHSMNKLAEIRSINLLSKPSPSITLSDMNTLREIIQNEVDKNDVDGVVITHGTDTLEETAYLMELTVDTQKPIVFTGSMRNVSDLGFDGPANLASAIKTASSDDAFGKGVLVVLNDVINPAQSTTKTHTSKLSTFESINYGPLGMVDGDRVIFHRENHSSEIKHSITSLSKNVAVIKIFSDMTKEFFNLVTSLNLDGLVIEAFGRGNVPPAICDRIEELCNNGMPIVLTSRCFKGNVSPTYSYVGGGKDLENRGVIFSGTLDSQKARIKLLVALESGCTKEQIAEDFAINA